MSQPAAATTFPHQHHDIINKQSVKEDLSRMEGEYGAKMLGKLKQMNVCIIGMNGLGIETSKNLILAGIASVSIYDQHKVQIADLGANFYVTEQNVTAGHTRTAAAIAHLAELNPNVQVIELKQIDVKQMDKYDVVVLCDDTPLQIVVEYNQAAHSNGNTAFIYAQTNGVTGLMFSDFGDKHDVFDADGLPNRTIIVDHITHTTNGQGLVTIDGDRHLLNNGDHIKFDEVKGMSNDDMQSDDEMTFGIDDKITDINQICEIKTTKNPKQFLIGNISQLGQYKSGGLGTQVKKPVVMSYKPIGSTLYTPTYNEQYFDFSKFGRNEQLHLARLSVWQFQQQTGHLPRLHSEDDASAVSKIAEQLNQQHKLVDEIDANIVRNTSLYYQTELTAFTALFGGVVAQEVTKKTGKYTPVQQWFHFDSFELLPSLTAVAPDAKPQNSRYDHQISIFGAAVQKRIEQQNLFMVGCGALGCEYLKSIALTGLGTNGGAVHITDDDRIELSNLSRQFLFRRQHVGKAKSVSAGSAAIEMNKALKSALHIHEIRVEPKTEDTFDDAFWQKLDFVLNALDNMQARKYVDSQCVWYEKPLFESGTLGTQANSVVCLPHKTPSYSEGAVAGEEGGIAKCTLRNFPSDIVHCIEYAREKYDDLYVSGADNANNFTKDKAGFLERMKADPLQRIDTLKSVKQWLTLNAQPTPELCVQLLYNEFITTYRDSILDLITAFPADARIIERHTKADLGPFWHGHKRFPTAVLQFDPSDPLHVDYVYHGTNIMTKVFGLPELSREEVTKIAASIVPPVWKYSGAVNVEDEKALKDGDAVSSSEILPETTSDTNMNNVTNTAQNGTADKPDDDTVVAELTTELDKLLPSARKHALSPQEFEKDDPTNHHVDWITAATNLRAWNYQLKPATLQKTRMTAGKIIPAIATTTATITGFILIEIYKYLCQQPLDNFRAASINLGTNTYVCENLPDPLKRKSGMDQATYMEVKAIPEGFTTWDHITIRAPGCTVQEFIDLFKEQHHNCEMDMLATNDGQVLYNAMDLYGAPERAAEMKQRLNMKLLDLFIQVAGPVFPTNRTTLQLDCTVETEDGETGIVPKIKYVFA